MPQKKREAEIAVNCRQDPGGRSHSASALSAMGLNDNLDFMGRQLHVQTENMSSPAMSIVTQVFCNGRVVFSTRSAYPPGVRESQNLKQVQDLMRAQHLRVIEKIRNKKAEILGAL